MNDSEQHNIVNLAQTYNDVPYTSKVFAHCQPTRLHALAKIKGLDPTPLETAKVLEIGCSFGGNLLPYAIRYPNSQLVGIDLAEHQINIGKQMMQAVGVHNVELVAADISQVSFNIQFDYIICHGVFSWVPESVQQAILHVIQSYLSPNGVAFISYNTYPGWKLKDITKELMLFGSNVNLPALQRVDQAFETLKFTRNILERAADQFPHVLSSIFKETEEKAKYYIAHEYLENYNNPLYFKDFIQQISQYNLAYLTDSARPIILNNLIFKDNEYESVCEFFNKRVESIEQYVDFIINRQFRTSIITHKGNLETHNITNNIDEYSLCHHFYDVYLFASVEFIEATDEKPAHWTFLNNEYAIFSSTPLIDALFKYIQSRNEPCKVREIFDALSSSPNYNEQEVINIIFMLIHSDNVYISFFAEPHSVYTKKPNIMEKYRNFIHFVMLNPTVTFLSNKYYQSIQLDFFSQYLAKYLDGTRTISGLIKQIRQDFKEGIISLSRDDTAVEIDSISDNEIKKLINNSLSVLDAYGYFNHY